LFGGEDDCWGLRMTVLPKQTLSEGPLPGDGAMPRSGSKKGEEQSTLLVAS
jgi:hypothetical protein